MSGLVGLFDPGGLRGSESATLLEEMAAAVTYTSGASVDRWQDERLALARVHHGVLNAEPQPVSSPDRSLYAAMAGEVSACDGERRRLRPETGTAQVAESDVELCLRVFQRDGEAAVSAFNGAFALLFYRPEPPTLWLVTDRFSSHPLYTYFDGGRLLFATQIRALLCSPAVHRRIDRQAVFQYLAVQTVTAETTLLEDIKALAPGAILRVASGVAHRTRYWNMRYEPARRTDREHEEVLADALGTAVARATRGNHRFTLLLSGGLDSRAVLAFSEKAITGITVADFSNFEASLARRVARAAGAEHELIERGVDHYVNLVDEAVAIGDGSFRFDHAHLLGCEDRIAARGDVVLDAYGFDVLLKDYFLARRSLGVLGGSNVLPLPAKITDPADLSLWGRVAGCLLNQRVQNLVALHRREEFMDTVRQMVAEAVARIHSDDPRNLTDPAANSFRSFHGYLLVLALRAKHPQRSVVLDNQLLAACLSLPVRLRVGGTLLKRVLAQRFPKLASIPTASSGLPAGWPLWGDVAAAVTRRILRATVLRKVPALPHPYASHGSWPHMGALLRHNPRMRSLLEETLSDPACVDPDLFDPSGVQATLARHMAGKEDNSGPLMLLLTFGRWYRRTISSP